MKKLIVTFLSLLMFIALLSGCAPSPASSGSAGSGNTIRLLTHYKNEIDAVKGAFEESTGITVEVDSIAWDEVVDTYEVILSSGSSEYDVLVVDGPNTAAYQARGYLAPLTAYFTPEEISAFSPALVAQGTVDGAFYSAPLGDSSTTLFYNTQLLEEAGIEWDWSQYDGENRITWEDVIEIAKKAQAALDPDGVKNITGVEFGQVSMAYMMNTLANSLGGANINDDATSVDGVLNGEAWLKALNWYQELVADGVCSRGVAVGETYNNFYVGKSVFIIMTADSIPYIESSGMAADAYGYTYVPAFKGYEDKVATGCGNWTMAVSNFSNNKDAAGQFVHWMTYGAGNDEFFMAAAMVPNMDSRFTDEAFAVNPILVQSQYECANTAVVRAVTPGFNEYAAAINTMWEDIRNGANIEEAVKTTIEQIDKALTAYK